MYYGQSKYGVSKYAENMPSDEELKKYFVNLYKYVPQFIYELPEMEAIYYVEGLELGLLKWQIEDVLKQFNVDTATWGLRIYEDKYGIQYNPSMSYESRREVIKAAIRGKGVADTYRIKIVAESFSGGECNVIRHDREKYFTIQFVGIKGIPTNMQALINEIKKIKPSHMGFDFKYTYTSWDYLDNKDLSYNSAESIKWDDIEIYD